MRFLPGADEFAGWREVFRRVQSIEDTLRPYNADTRTPVEGLRAQVAARSELFENVDALRALQDRRRLARPDPAPGSLDAS